jgi:Ssp1 endopeptidase immunity protein Rap1a
LISVGQYAFAGALAYVLMQPTAPASAQAELEPPFSAAYWRDVCGGYRVGLSQVDQKRRCTIYLSSFQDASDEYGEAGVKLFCPPDAVSTETVRRVFLGYVSEFQEAAEFLPAGRALVQALRQAYPCTLKN